MTRIYSISAILFVLASVTVAHAAKVCASGCCALCSGCCWSGKQLLVVTTQEVCRGSAGLFCRSQVCCGLRFT